MSLSHSSGDLGVERVVLTAFPWHGPPLPPGAPGEQGGGGGGEISLPKVRVTLAQCPRLGSELAFSAGQSRRRWSGLLPRKQPWDKVKIPVTDSNAWARFSTNRHHTPALAGCPATQPHSDTVRLEREPPDPQGEGSGATRQMPTESPDCRLCF